MYSEPNFDVPIYGVLSLGPIDIWITSTLVVTFAICAVLIIFAIIVRIKLKNFKEKPTGFQNVVEMMVEMFDKFTRTNAGDKLHWLGGWGFTVFAFLLLANTIGVVSVIRPPTADWPVPLAIALTTFFLINFVALRYRAKSFLKGLFEPIFLFFPLNLMGELARPMSLSFRLFGNVLGGFILVSIIGYSLLPWFTSFIVPVPLHLVFDLAFGALQAFVFTILSLTYLGGAAATEE